MSLHLPPFREERLTYNRSPGKSRISSRYISKLPYFFSIPTFSLENTWRGVSEIIRKYYYVFEKNFSILDYLAILPDGNYIPCISWKVDDVVYRYKLWYDNTGLLYVPNYDGRAISKNFYLEIWSTNSELIEGGGTNLKISQFKIPIDLCDQNEVDLSPSFDTCNDMRFDMNNFDPAEGDHYVVINTCLDTDQIFGMVPEITINLGSMADNIEIDITAPDTEPDFYEIWKKTSSLDWFLLDTIPGNVLVYNDLSVISADFWEYKIRSKVGDDYSNYSNIVGVSENYGFPGTGDVDLSTLVLSLTVLFFDDSTNITHIDLSSLRQVNGGLVVSSSLVLELIDLDKLESIDGDFDISNCPALTELNLPLLDSITGMFTCSICGVLTDLVFSVITQIGGDFSCDACFNLNNLVLSNGGFTFNDGLTLAFDSCALPASNVNNILAIGVASGITSCTISLGGGTNSAPTGQGILDKAALITAGNSVTTN